MTLMRRCSLLLCLSSVLASTAAAQMQTNYSPDYTRGPKAWPSFTSVYKEVEVPVVDFANSPRLDQLIRDGKLYMSLSDAIALAIENNLDIAYARYAPKLADADILRASAGGQLRGVQTQISTLSTGQSVAGGTGGGGGDETGIDERAGGGGGGGGADVGDASTFFGTTVPQLDPTLFAGIDWGHFSNPQTSNFVTGTNFFIREASASQIGISKNFLTGTTATLRWNNFWQDTNSVRRNFDPSISTNLSLRITQSLLRGFGRDVNSRIIRVAKNNREISDLAFKQQVIETVSRMRGLYWDLVSLTAVVRGRQEDLRLAEQLYEDNKKRVEIGTLAPIEIVRAEAEVAARQQDLTLAVTRVQQQETVIKNAISKNGLASPSVLEVEIVPTDQIELPAVETIPPIQELMKTALKARPELAQSLINLENRDINLKGVRNALRPDLSAFVDFTNNGLAGQLNNNFQGLPGEMPEIPEFFLGGLGGALGQVFRRNFPDYQFGVQLRVPLWNRRAQADMSASMLERRRAEIRLRQSENTIRQQVKNALISLEQARARHTAAEKARVLQERTLEAEQKKFNLGASTIFLVVQAQRDLALARVDQISAENAYIQAKNELDRSTARTLEIMGVSIDEALSGQVSKRADPLPTEPQAAVMDFRRQFAR